VTHPQGPSRSLQPVVPFQLFLLLARLHTSAVDTTRVTARITLCFADLNPLFPSALT
jgi:hypothetical protein